MKCSKIRSLIDESDRPDRLAPEILSHTALCTECRVFAEERARLSELLVSVGRVNAPPNFDAMLGVRLAEQAARPSPALIPAMFFRFGGAMAVMVLVVLGAVYMKRSPATDPLPQSQSTERQGPEAANGDTAASNRADIALHDSIATTPVHDHGPGKVRNSPSPRSRGIARDTVDPGPVFWLKTDEVEVGVPVVSTGAQSLYYATAGQPSVRTVKTSF